MTLKGGTTQACAACKYQRRKCTSDCALAPFFPADHPRMFQNAHKLFGVSNILKILKQIDPSQKPSAMSTIIYESNMRERFPVTGCHGLARSLELQIFELSKELYHVQRLLAFHRQSCNEIPSNALNLFDQNHSNYDLNVNVNDNVHVNGVADNNLMWLQQVGDQGGGFFDNVDHDNDYKNSNNNQNEISMQYELQKLTLQGEDQQKVEYHQDEIHPFFDTVDDNTRHSFIHNTDAYESSCEPDTAQSLELTLLRPN